MVMVMNMMTIWRLVVIMMRRIMMIMTLLSFIMIISYQFLSAKNIENLYRTRRNMD